MELQHALRVGEGAFEFGDLSRWQVEYFSLHVGRYVILQRVVLLERRRRRQITLDRVVERRNIRGTLNRSVAAKRHNAGTRPADVAQQKLQQRAGADDLDAVGVLRPGDGVGE